MTTTFDPVAYKQTTRHQWDRAATAWHRHGPTLTAWLGDVTEQMLDMARVGPGDHVLDVAAGTGQQSLAAARRVGPSGRVLATDISEAILAYAADEARAAGLTTVETRAMDGEDLDAIEDGCFDVVISRVGLIYLPDQPGALRGMVRTLRPGGRVAAIVYSEAERNRFFSIPVGVIRRRANLPAPLPGQPGPFSLGNPAVLEGLFTDAGLEGVEVRRVPAPVRLPTARDCVTFERESFGALHQMMSGLDAEAQEEVWEEIAQELSAFEGPDGFEGPCEMLIAAGSR